MVSLSTWLAFTVLAAPIDVEVIKFTSSTCAPCQAIEPALEQIAERGFAVRRIDVDLHSDLVREYRITSVPTLLIVSRGQVVDRIEGVVPLEALLPRLESLAASANQSASLQRSVDRDGHAVRVASFESEAPPGAGVASGNTPDEIRALQATVRLRVEDADGHSFGTGTVIDVHGHDALVLTCGHIFRDSQGKGKIVVDFFALGAQEPVEAELIRYDLKRDLALVGVRTSARLQPIPVAPPSWQPTAGQTLFSVGCNHGEGPSVMNGRLKAVNKYLGPENLTVEGLPSEGRSGGGLFSTDGYLVGVCNAADPQLNEGLYAAFASVHRHLDEARLSFVYQRASASDQMADRAGPVHSASPTTGAPSQGIVATASAAQSPEQLWTPQSVADRGPAPTPTRGAPGTSPNPSEVICILRTPGDAESPSQVVVLDRPSRDFLSQLQEEQRAQNDRLATQSKWRQSATPRLTSERRLHRPIR